MAHKLLKTCALVAVLGVVGPLAACSTSNGDRSGATDSGGGEGTDSTSSSSSGGSESGSGGASSGSSSGGASGGGSGSGADSGPDSTVDGKADATLDGEDTGDGAVGPRFVSVSVGDTSACALTTTGSVECWGSPRKLGSGSTSLVPVPVTGLTGGVTTVSVGGSLTWGYDSACAITAAGGVECWGANGFGELGNDSSTNSLVPVPVTGLTSGVTAVSAGSLSACAITAAGGVECWGYDADGELGNNSTTNSLVPVPVTGLTSGVTSVSVGAFSSCAVTADGNVECWGYNGDGELGNNSTTSSSVPVPIVTSGPLDGGTDASIDAGTDASSESGAAKDAGADSGCPGVDTSSDLNNCGGCGVKCPQGAGDAFCSGGVCNCMGIVCLNYCVGVPCGNYCLNTQTTCTCEGCPAGLTCVPSETSAGGKCIDGG